jgi:hypothetical protein
VIPGRRRTYKVDNTTAQLRICWQFLAMVQVGELNTAQKSHMSWGRGDQNLGKQNFQGQITKKNMMAQSSTWFAKDAGLVPMSTCERGTLRAEQNPQASSKWGEQILRIKGQEDWLPGVQRSWNTSLERILWYMPLGRGSIWSQIKPTMESLKIKNLKAYLDKINISVSNWIMYWIKLSSHKRDTTKPCIQQW